MTLVSLLFFSCQHPRIFRLPAKLFIGQNFSHQMKNLSLLPDKNFGPIKVKIALKVIYTYCNYLVTGNLVGRNLCQAKSFVGRTFRHFSKSLSLLHDKVSPDEVCFHFKLFHHANMTFSFTYTVFVYKQLHHASRARSCFTLKFLC